MLTKFVLREWSTYKEVSPEMGRHSSLDLILHAPLNLLVTREKNVADIRGTRATFFYKGRTRDGIPIYEYVE